MDRKYWVFVNWGVLFLVTLFAIGVAWDFSSEIGKDNKEPIEEFVEECVDVKKASGFEYDACYDAYSKMIFLKIKRASEDYEINFLKISFVDFATRYYDLDDVPGAGEERAYKLSSEKNPRRIEIRLDVVRDFSEPICEASESVFIDYCPVAPVGPSGENGGVSVSPIKGVEIADFVEVKDSSDLDSDIFNLDLISEDMVWDSECNSDWECGEWEACDEGVQRRNCEDVADCFVPKDSPATVRGCEGQCLENWECEWAPCEGGVSVPKCKDLNDCGTHYNIPQKLDCGGGGSCVPDVECGEWSKCEVDYGFLDLIASGIADLEGSKSRVCTDRKECVLPSKEIAACSVSVDVYVKKFERCGGEYAGIYNILNDELLAVVRGGARGSPYLNIYLDERIEDIECSYCFDRIMNGDEESVDCGGSCRECVEDVVVEKGFWDWINRIF